MFTPKTLLIIAGILWAIAGLNITIIGLRCCLQLHQAWLYLAAIPVFLLFRYLIFGPVSHKYARRIAAFDEDRIALYRIFSIQGYLIMVFMIALGVILRVEHLVPLAFIAFFYLGLGLALILASWIYASEYRDYVAAGT
ncbi:MAG: hypothetical protein FWC48_00565 [Actinomycetia bacterium]|nr:hypothetical protein [Actinomycetes bacterium]